MTPSRLRRKLATARDALITELPPGTGIVIVVMHENSPLAINFSANVPPESAIHMARVFIDAMQNMNTPAPTETKQ